MRWMIVGADIATGRDITLSLDAATREEAESFAVAKGMVIAAVEGKPVAVEIGYGKSEKPPAQYVALLRCSWTMKIVGVVAIALGLIAFFFAALLFVLATVGASTWRDAGDTMISL